MLGSVFISGIIKKRAAVACDLVSSLANVCLLSRLFPKGGQTSTMWLHICERRVQMRANWTKVCQNENSGSIRESLKHKGKTANQEGYFFENKTAT